MREGRVLTSGWRPWRAAMSEALYGPSGFYRSTGAPARHFRTAAQVGPPWVAAIRELAQRVEQLLGHSAGFTVVDVGAGGGELLTGLAALAPAHWSLIGVDVAPRPAQLPERVKWRDEPPESVTGVVLGVELLDVVPIEVVEITDAGPRLIEVTREGEERLGTAPDDLDQRWLRQWWPDATAGDRIEIGRPRDEVWQRLAGTVRTGLALAVDYAIDPEVDRNGTLTGFRDGRQVAPTPDGSCDLTAHVCFDSLRRDGDLVMSQRDALCRLGTTGTTPRYDAEPAMYLAALSAAGDASELLSPDGLGAFRWLGRGVGLNAARLFDGSDGRESARPRRRRAAHTSARTSSTRR